MSSARTVIPEGKCSFTIQSPHLSCHPSSMVKKGGGDDYQVHWVLLLSLGFSYDVFWNVFIICVPSSPSNRWGISEVWHWGVAGWRTLCEDHRVFSSFNPYGVEFDFISCFYLNGFSSTTPDNPKVVFRKNGPKTCCCGWGSDQRESPSFSNQPNPP